jgi:hypothetical protein
MDYPKLITPILLTLFAALSLSIAYFERGRLPGWLEMVLVIMGVVLLVFSIVSSIDWILYKASLRLESYNRAASITPLTELAEAVRGLTDKQAAVVEAQRLTISIIPSVQLPVYSIIMPRGQVPRTFADEFLAAGTDREQRPTSYYSEGPKRQWANWLRDWTVAEGLAEQYGPNTPATWKGNGRELAMYAFGVEAPDKM